MAENNPRQAQRSSGTQGTPAPSREREGGQRGQPDQQRQNDSGSKQGMQQQGDQTRGKPNREAQDEGQNQGQNQGMREGQTAARRDDARSASEDSDDEPIRSGDAAVPGDPAIKHDDDAAGSAPEKKGSPPKFPREVQPRSK